MIGMPFEEPQRLRAADDMRQREGAARIERGDGERRRIGLAADRYVGGDHELRMQQREIRGRRLDRACVFGDEGVARGAQPCPEDGFVSQGWPRPPTLSSRWGERRVGQEGVSTCRSRRAPYE